MSKRKHKCQGYADLGDLEEDKRIDLIGRYVMNKLKTAAVVVDDIPGKSDRYISKLRKRFPGIEIVEQGQGPVAKTWVIKVGPPNVENN